MSSYLITNEHVKKKLSKIQSSTNQTFVIVDCKKEAMKEFVRKYVSI